MEEQVEYTTGGRPGRSMIGGYIRNDAAERLRRAAELKGMTVTQFLEWLATRVDVTLRDGEA